jgi:hypothetical protein
LRLPTAHFIGPKKAGAIKRRYRILYSTDGMFMPLLRAAFCRCGKPTWRMRPYSLLECASPFV